MKKFFSLMCAIIISVCTIFVASCDLEDNKPDYSKYTDTFDFYGYSSANNGTYKLDGQTIKVCDSLMTTTQYQYYKDCGMTIFFPQSAAKISTDSPTSDFNNLKSILADLKSVGITKTVIYDERFAYLGCTTSSLIGEGKKFATEDDLDEKIYNYLKLYANEEGVYGIMLGDEPKYAYLTAYSQVYKSVKRVCEKYDYNLFIHYNLNPFIADKTLFNNIYPYVEGTDTYSFDNCFTRYKKYITDYLDAMEPEYIQYDSYPMLNGKIADYYIPCLQFIAGEAAKRGIKFYNVTQAFEMKVNGNQQTRGMLSESEAKWLNNMLIGFGVQQIAYFTYYTKADNSTTGELFVDNSSFINRNGERTQLYYTMKNIIANDQKFAPTIFQFTYKGSKIIKKVPMNITSSHISHVDNTATFTTLQDATIDKNCALITELYDETNKYYMYMAQNVVDPVNTDDVDEVVVLNFGSSYKNALVYHDGSPTTKKLTNGSIELTIAPGDAYYVIPY